MSRWEQLMTDSHASVCKLTKAGTSAINFFSTSDLTFLHFIHHFRAEKISWVIVQLVVLSGSNFDNAKMPNTCLFQLLKCQKSQKLCCFSNFIFISNLIVLGFQQLVGQNNPFLSQLRLQNCDGLFTPFSYKYNYNIINTSDLKQNHRIADRVQKCYFATKSGKSLMPLLLHQVSTEARDVRAAKWNQDITGVELSDFHVLRVNQPFAESSWFPANPDGLCLCKDTAAMTWER